MDSKTYGIIGGVVFVIGLISFFMGSSKSAERNYTQAETLFQHREYQGAIEKYQKAIKASKRLGAKTKHIHKDFPTLAKYKIVLCYDKLAATKNDDRYYSKAILLIDKTVAETVDYKHRENLYYLWAQILHKKKEYVQAELKYSYFISEFPNSALVVEALYYNGIINKELSLKIESEVSIKRINDSQESFQRIIDEFPTSKYRSEAEAYIRQLIVAEDNRSDNIDSETDDQRMYDTALKALDAGDIYEAYQLFIGIIDEYPRSQLISSVYERVGDMFYNAGNTVNARHYYENAILTNTDNDRNHLLKNRYNRTLLKPKPPVPLDDKKAMNELFTKAILLRKKGEYLEAAKIFETFAKTKK
ncbi:outer membrane protein assembly factor BamD, partial [Candidatus Poribacteria bacterium]|nr:outer membrane protein assembly factor BamD [Candidatus Poribacteria bacterium]